MIVTLTRTDRKSPPISHCGQVALSGETVADFAALTRLAQLLSDGRPHAECVADLVTDAAAIVEARLLVRDLMGQVPVGLSLPTELLMRVGRFLAPTSVAVGNDSQAPAGGPT